MNNKNKQKRLDELYESLDMKTKCLVREIVELEIELEQESNK